MGAAPEVRGVLVLGMHRSGTSAVAGVLHALGLATCAPHDLIGPTAWNPRGLWESRSLIALNDMLLAGARRSWWHPPPDEPDYSRIMSCLAPLAGTARSRFDALHPPAGWIWKDPRTALLLPLWREALAPFAAVLVIRDPFAVAGSLDRRNGLTAETSVALWCRYSRLLLRHCPGLPVLVTRYEALLEDTVASVGELAAFLDDLGLAGPGGADLRSACRLLEPSLRHEDGQRVAPPRQAAADARHLADLLASLVGRQLHFPTLDIGPEPLWVEHILSAQALQKPTWREHRGPAEWAPQPAIGRAVDESGHANGR